MPQKISVPRLFSNAEDVEIIEWLKKEGEEVNEGEDILIVQTDKVAVSVETPCSGRLFRIVVGAGERAGLMHPVGVLICPGDDEAAAGEMAQSIEREIERAGSGEVTSVAVPPPRAEVAPQPPADDQRRLAKASPVARRLAEEHGVDLNQIAGTGPDGRITKENILQFVEKQKSAPPVSKDRGITVPPNSKIIPLTGMRKGIADQMGLSARTVARVTLLIEVDMEAVVRLRRRLMPTVQEKAGVRLTYNHFVIKAAAETLADHPRLNATWGEGAVYLRDEVNIGVAVALDDGLLTPVIKRANQKNLAEIAQQAVQLQEKARQKKLGAEELSGGTFTVSTLGSFGIDGFTPIINVPEVAVLGVGRVIQKPAAVDGRLEPRWMVTLSLSFDHRAVDGVPAAEFLRDLKERLESPGSI